MASIEVIIRDDDGNMISQKPAQEVNLKNASLDMIEARWKAGASKPYRR